MEGFITREFLEANGEQMYRMLKESDESGRVIEKKVMDEIIHQAYKQELIKKLRQRIGNSIDAYLDSEEFLNNNPIFKAEKERQDKIMTRYLFLTVNPEPSITLKMIIDITKKSVNKVWMKNYLYVYEQRGTTIEEAGLKPHIHMIIDTDIGKKRHEIIRELKNTFKKLCDVNRNEFFNIRNIKDNHLKNYIKYITGRKKDEIKNIKQDVDKEFRKKYQLEPYYGDGELLELVEKNEETILDFDYELLV